MSLNIKYCGSALDYSGYGEANRHDIAALVSAGIEITVECPKYTVELADFGELGSMVGALTNRKLDYNIKILHTTPNVYGRYYEQGKYHIARAFWETDRLPPDFVSGLNIVDEIWTGSRFNKEAMVSSGIKKPIFVIPEAIDTNKPDVKPYIVSGQELFKFYSIFEWTERKNPCALLEAYWREFEHTEGVGLYLKTYVDNFTLAKKLEIDEQIKKLKAKLNLSRYADVYLYRDLMDRQQVYRFHQTFDCFVSAHRGEGWGIPQMEALLMGNPVISTNCGGIHEWLTDGVDALLVSHKLIPIVENSRNRQWYTADQKWADIDVEELRKAMRVIFTDKNAREKIAKSGQQIAHTLFSLENVGRMMFERLEQINLERK